MKVLFVCTGNYYRSRFAEIYFNYVAKRQQLDMEAFSRGFRTSNPENVGYLSPYTIDWLNCLKIALPKENRYPEMLTETDLILADKIIALKETEHRPFVQTLFPEWESRFEFWHINDIQDEAPVSAIQALKTRIDVFVTHLPIAAS